MDEGRKGEAQEDEESEKETRGGGKEVRQGRECKEEVIMQSDRLRW